LSVRNAAIAQVRGWAAGWTGVPWVASVKPDPGLTPAVVITGGSSGIGRAIAAEFVAEGRTVVLVARTQTTLNAAKSELIAAAPTTNARVETIALDVTTTDAPATLAASLASLGLYADVLVLSAGTGLAGPFDSHPQSEIDHLLALNVAAPTNLIRHFLPAMKSRARGGVLAVSSLGGYVPGPHQAAYYASKAYLCSLTEAIGTELAGTGVRMTVLAPGPVETAFHARMGAEGSLYRRLLPAISPQRTASAAVWGYHLGRRVVVPGLIPKLFAVSVSVLPHWVTGLIVSGLLFRRVGGP